MGSALRKVEDTNIYIGNMKEAMDEQLLREHNIKAILNVSDLSVGSNIPGIAQFWVKMSDPLTGLAPDNPLTEAVAVLSLARSFAERHGGNVLVHCVHGHNRSALTAAIWLMDYDKRHIPLKDAVRMTQVKDNKPWMKQFGLIWDKE